MIRTSNHKQQSAFSHWLRTGRLPVASANGGIELKFNPWHDPDDGRFTFAGSGRHYGAGGGQAAARPGASGTSRGARPARRITKIQYVEDPRRRPISTREEVEAWRVEQLEKNGRKPGYPEAIEKQYRRYLDVISPRLGIHSDKGAGGDFGGGGATGSWGGPESELTDTDSTSSPKRRPPKLPAGNSASAREPQARAVAIEPRREVVRNGYTYEIDSRDRTRRVSGTLSVTNTPVRSRTSQIQAGGADRRVGDDGGHYIAPRFRGPTDAFNHFAQDANVNRGRYRLLEDEWARDKRAGRSVTVRIVPKFDGTSMRPSEINVWWTVNGQEKSQKFPNERSERSGGK